MNRQLFHVLPTMELPVSAIRHDAGTHVTTQIIPAFPFMYWPSNKPCEPVNMYLLDIAHGVTGGTLKTYASDLSHLVRYCGVNNVGIEHLNGAHLHALSKQLQEKRSHRHPLEPARDRNTVRGILSRSIQFLLWYQETFMPHLSTPLIGEQSVSPQIIVKRVKNDRDYSRGRHSEYYYTHTAMPPPENREPKRPIARPIIEDIQRAIYRQSVLEERSERFTQRYANNRDLLRAQLEYIRARRMFMIWMMMRTGLRPAELIEMSVKDHENILTTRTLKIPTKKRRKVTAPIRHFPILLDAATVIYRYLLSRTAYCDALKRAGIDPEPGTAFFLTLGGKPLQKTSLEKDFERLVVLAGHKDIQACLSMFRHRFITYEVTVHLKEFIENSGKSRQMMTDIDYESILKRVSDKTGHGSVKSLWQYIDLAWEELGVWASTDKALARLHAFDQLFADGLLLKYELELSGKHLPKELQPFLDRLADILAPAKEQIEGNEPGGKACKV
ncbi:site-specific integrase [Pseudogulbenkiania subflava]|uniref:Phage integrase family protein n=1 Tax=Pseudogulbenkiania subflava DSM 22618 TaxID=1123014 RepID=A0A1Y6BK77_9NEIS|nr:site-specific integrase [Pseudogulbenkiania subflava]SMF13805.1 Phage integrase family protein [Pseudogulbenkiania subflava DSM 22618]